MSTASPAPVPAAPNPPPPGDAQPAALSPAVRLVTVVAVVVVALIAATVSFAHMYGVAHSHGEDWRSWLIPVSIDGLVVAASMVLLTRHRARLPGGWLAWGALVAGVLASLGANVADAQSNITARLLAGWPALAFAVAFELLLQQRRADHAASAQVSPVPLDVPLSGPRATPAPATPTPPPSVAPAPRPEPVVTAPAMATRPLPAPKPAQRVSPTGVASPPEPEPLQTRLRGLIGRTGRVPGRRTVAAELGISEHAARVLLDKQAPLNGALK